MALGALAVAAAAAGPGSVLAASSGFSVSGKKGPFVRQVAGRSFAGASGGGAMGLAADAVNAGQYQAARLRMPRTEAKVAELLARLDSQWPYAREAPVRVNILGVDYFNAYSLPDSSIVVAFGLLDQAQSDDEVAFVLAHELGHLRLGHFHAQARQAGGVLPSRIGQALLVDAALSGAGASGSALAVSAARAGAANDWLHFLTRVGKEPGHTRAQEDEADCIGYDLSLTCAFAADEASARVFDSISADQQKRAALADSLNAQLKEELSHVVTPAAALSILGGGLNAGSLRNGLLAGAGRMALGMAANSQEGGPQHRPPEERKRGLAQYSADAYPQGAPLREEQRTWLAQVRGTDEYAHAKVTVEAVAETQRLRAAGNYAGASAAINRAFGGGFGQAPLVLNEAARLRDDMGDAPGADRLFTRAHLSPDQTVDGYLDHVRMLYRTKQNDRALQIIQQGVTVFNDDKPFLSLLIAVSRQAGRRDDAERYLGECIATGDEALANDCRLAAGKKAESEKRRSSPFGLPFGLPH
jgi:predicted Zn-dependent protease